MRVTVAVQSYNPRRYGRPWIAVVTAWPVGKPPELRWGRYLGDDRGGECEIEAEEGEILRYGQKDLRGNRTENEWGLIQPDGSIKWVAEPAAREAHEVDRLAAKHFG